jgi:phage terminase large subunit GpA-like protein
LNGDPYSEGFLAGLKPDPLLTVSQWADEHRVLSQKASSEAGRWRTSRTPYLKEIMDSLSPHSKSQRVVFMAGVQLGKALAIDTPIPTPAGWSRMGDLKVGDLVFDECGNQCRVTFVTKTMYNRKCFNVLFSDGQSIVADADHKWTVDISRRGKAIGTRTLTTKDMLPIYKKGRINNLAIPVTKPLRCNRKKMLIDPYCLGAWLGDGNSYSAQITYHKKDFQIISAFEKAGFNVVKRKVKTKSDNVMNAHIDPKPVKAKICEWGHDTSIMGLNPRGRCNACQSAYSAARYRGEKPPKKLPRKKRFVELLGELKLLKNKHIPPAYLRASMADRWALFRGLMDTDGHITKKGYLEFCTISEKLSVDFMELAHSLGLKPSRRLKKNVNAYVITFAAYADQKVFSLKRKQARLKKRRDGRASESTRRRIIDISPVKSVPVRCITVDSKSHLYLAGRGMIPTHNTEAGNNWLGYVISHSPGPMLIVQPTVKLAERFSKQRLDPMIEESPMLKDKIKPARARDSGNTTLSKDFQGGVVMLTGANSAVGLRSMPIRFLFLDEIDAYPSDVEGEGDPVTLAEARTTTFSRKKIFMVSTPTIKDISRIEREFLASDQRRFFLPCPHCNNFDWLQWKNIKWVNNDPRTVYMTCTACGSEIYEHSKTEMLLNGHWRATDESSSNSAGFHLSSLYSPLGWKSWADIVHEFLQAQNDPPRLKTWTNTCLAETWEDQATASLEYEIIAERAEVYELRTVPKSGLLLTAGIDVQDNRLAVVVRAWGVDEESWLVDWVEIYGDPSDLSDRGPWFQLDSYLKMEFQHETGARLNIYAAAIDTGGHFTHEAYIFCRDKKARRIIAIKGASQAGKPAISKPTFQDINYKKQVFKKGVELWMIGVDTIKSTIYGRLRKPSPSGAGSLHFPIGVGIDYYKQLTAEKQKTVFQNGFAKRQWVKAPGARNEALDCEVYAYAALQFIYTRTNRGAIWLQAQGIIDRLLAKQEVPATKTEASPPVKTIQRPTVNRAINRKTGFVKGW